MRRRWRACHSVVVLKTIDIRTFIHPSLIYKNGSIPPGWRKKTTREKLMTSAANAVERDNSTRPRKLSLLECQTYCKADIQQILARRAQARLLACGWWTIHSHATGRVSRAALDGARLHAAAAAHGAR